MCVNYTEHQESRTMKLWKKMTLYFSLMQLLVTLAIGGTVVMVVRSTVRAMVAAESRAMLGAITGAA